jgi:hypothetical protein
VLQQLQRSEATSAELDAMSLEDTVELLGAKEGEVARVKEAVVSPSIEISERRS